MTTYTLSELATKVLRYENLVGSEETPRASDSLDTQVIIRSEMFSMQARGISLWNQTTGAVSDEYLMPLVKRLGPVVGASFGKYTTMEATSAAYQIEMLELRRLSSVGPTGEIAEGEYF
jgi:hypothetical protein